MLKIKIIYCKATEPVISKEGNDTSIKTEA